MLLGLVVEGLGGDGAVLGWQWRWSGAVMGNVMSMCG